MSTYRNKIKELLDAKKDIERQSSALYKKQHAIDMEIVELKNLVIKSEELLRTGAWDVAPQKGSIYLNGDEKDFPGLMKFTGLGAWGTGSIYLDRNVTLSYSDNHLYIQISDHSRAAWFIREWGIVVTSTLIDTKIRELNAEASSLRSVIEIIKREKDDKVAVARKK